LAIDASDAAGTRAQHRYGAHTELSKHFPLLGGQLRDAHSSADAQASPTSLNRVHTPPAHRLNLQKASVSLQGLPG
jgi:hypothetical protein